MSKIDEYREYRSPADGKQYDPGVAGLAQLGRNAIERVTELERALAERDETIRALNLRIGQAEFAVEAAERELQAVRDTPTVAWLATQQQRNPSQCVVTTMLDGWDHVELIARPARKGE